MDRFTLAFLRPFPKSLYEMVDDPSTDSKISWSESGKSFIVRNESEFCIYVLGKYTGLATFSSFTCMLDLYGINKVEDSDHDLEFAHDSLVRGKPELATSLKFALTTPQSYLDVKERIKKRALAIEEKKKKWEEKMKKKKEEEMKKKKEEEQTRSVGLRI